MVCCLATPAAPPTQSPLRDTAPMRSGTSRVLPSQMPRAFSFACRGSAAGPRQSSRRTRLQKDPGLREYAAASDQAARATFPRSPLAARRARAGTIRPIAPARASRVRRAPPATNMGTHNTSHSSRSIASMPSQSHSLSPHETSLTRSRSIRRWQVGYGQTGRTCLILCPAPSRREAAPVPSPGRRPPENAAQPIPSTEGAPLAPPT